MHRFRSLTIDARRSFVRIETPRPSLSRVALESDWVHREWLSIRCLCSAARPSTANNAHTSCSDYRALVAQCGSFG